MLWHYLWALACYFQTPMKRTADFLLPLLILRLTLLTFFSELKFVRELLMKWTILGGHIRVNRTTSFASQNQDSFFRKRKLSTTVVPAQTSLPTGVVDSLHLIVFNWPRNSLTFFNINYYPTYFPEFRSLALSPSLLMKVFHGTISERGKVILRPIRICRMNNSKVSYNEMCPDNHYRQCKGQEHHLKIHWWEEYLAYWTPVEGNSTFQIRFNFFREIIW